MSQSKKKKVSIKVFLPLFAGIAVLSLMSFSMARTSSTDYCMSCHEMKPYKEELEKSTHAVDKDKDPIQCHQCHVPPRLGLKYVAVKAVLGVKDLWVHNFGDPDNLDRRQMQVMARRFIVDENCRQCHEDLTLDTEGKPLSEIGKLSHDAYLGNNGNTKRGCAGCHFNMAHLPRFDRRYDFNAEFAKRLKPLEEKSE